MECPKCGSKLIQQGSMLARPLFVRLLYECSNCFHQEVVEYLRPDEVQQKPKTKGGFLAARGAFADTWNGEPAEVTIRRLRDAD